MISRSNINQQDRKTSVEKANNLIFIISSLIPFVAEDICWQMPYNFKRNDFHIWSQWVTRMCNHQIMTAIPIMTSNKASLPYRRKRRGRPSIDGDTTAMHRGHYRRYHGDIGDITKKTFLYHRKRPSSIAASLTGTRPRHLRR